MLLIYRAEQEVDIETQKNVVAVLDHGLVMLTVEKVTVVAPSVTTTMMALAQVIAMAFFDVVFILVVIFIFIFLNVFTDNVDPGIITDYIALVPQRACACWFLVLPCFPTGVAEFIAAHASHMVATLCEFNHVIAFGTVAPHPVLRKVF